MVEFEISNNFSIGFIGRVMFMFAMLFLLWMVFKAIALAHERGSNLFQKILGTTISGCVLIFNLLAWNRFPAFFNNWAYSLSQLDSLSPGGQRFVDNMEPTGYLDAGLVPSDPVSTVFWLGIAIALLMGIWSAPKPKA